MKIVCHVMKECIDKVDMAIKYILYLEFRDLICGLSVYQFNLQQKEQMWAEQFSGRSMCSFKHDTCGPMGNVSRLSGQREEERRLPTDS